MSRVVVIGASRALEHQMRVLLGDDVVALTPASSDVMLTRIVALPRRPELVLLGDYMPTDIAVEIARTVHQLSDVVALVTDDVGVREGAKRAGVAEFIGTDPELEQVEALLGRSRQLALRVRSTGVAARENPSVPGWIISVISPKGGVGKSTVASNLAVALAGPESRVVVVDLDLQFGDIAGLLGVDARDTVVDALGKSAARDEFVLRTLLTPHSPQLAVLGAPESPAAADRVDAHRIGHLLRQLAAEFDHVIVDTSPGLTEPTLAAIEQSDAVVAIGGLDMSSVRGLRKSLELLKELRLLPRVVQVVLNGVEKQLGLSVADAERVIGLPIDVVVPRRKAVAVAGNHALSVLVTAPRDPASKAFRSVARRLEAELALKDWRGAASRPARRLAGATAHPTSPPRPTLDLYAIDKETAS